MNRFKLTRAVEELWNLYGPDAYKAATQRAEAVEHRGRITLARDWREIADVCSALKDLPPRKG